MGIFSLGSLFRSAVRGVIFLGILSFIGSSVVVLIHSFTIIITLILDLLSQFPKIVRGEGGGSSKVLSCFYHMLSIVGINSILSQLFTALVSLFVFAVGIVVEIIIIKVSLFIKKFLFDLF